MTRNKNVSMMRAINAPWKKRGPYLSERQMGDCAGLRPRQQTSRYSDGELLTQFIT